MSKKKIARLNKDYYVADEYGHSDAVVVRKINELISVVNRQQEVIHNFELLLNHSDRKRGK